MIPYSYPVLFVLFCLTLFLPQTQTAVNKRSSFWKKAGIVLTVIVAALYLLVCLVPWLGSGSIWFIAILGLAFPLLLALLLILLLVWAIRRSRWALFCGVSLLLGWQQVSVLFPLNVKASSAYKPEGTIRVLSWNVSRWDERNKEKRGGQSYRKKMMDFIASQEADILCLQEFFECHDPNYYEANIPALKALGFGYYHFYPSTELFGGKFQYGLAIFSKYPILAARDFTNEAKVHSEGLCYADISFNGKITRVFNSHLESPGFNKNDFREPGQVKMNAGVLYKLKNSYWLRNRQAGLASREIGSSPYPVIVCSDLGDVPNSYAYFRLRGGLRDAFLEKGRGLGRTYRFISPTLRIDYIFTGKQTELVNYRCPGTVYSDHFPLIADFK